MTNPTPTPGQQPLAPPLEAPPLAGDLTARALTHYQTTPGAAAQYAQDRPFLEQNGADIGKLDRHFAAIKYLQSQPDSSAAFQKLAPEMRAQGFNLGMVSSHLPGGAAYQLAHPESLGSTVESGLETLGALPGQVLPKVGAEAEQVSALGPQPQQQVTAGPPPPGVPVAAWQIQQELARHPALGGSPFAAPAQMALHGAGEVLQGVAGQGPLLRRLGRTAVGALEYATPQANEALAGEAQHILSGVATPGAKRAAAVAAGRLASAYGGSIAGQAGAERLAKLAGVSPGGQQIAGAAGMILGGAGGARATRDLGVITPEQMPEAATTQGPAAPVRQELPAAVQPSSRRLPPYRGPGAPIEATQSPAEIAAPPLELPPSRVAGYQPESPLRVPLALPGANQRELPPSPVFAYLPPAQAAEPKAPPFQPEEGAAPQAIAPAPLAPQGPGPRGAAAQLPVAAPLAGLSGRATAVKTPSGDLPAQYKVVEAAQLEPSHHPVTFAPNPAYPPGVQERDYQRSQEAQARVIGQAQNFQPEFLISDNPDAVNGPPVVTPNGTVLGGNSRAMTLQRVYAEGRGEPYKHALMAQAARYGVDPARVAALQHPALVRVVPEPGGTEQARRIGSDLNRSFTGALSASELAASRGKAVSQGTMERLGSALDENPDLSLRDLIREQPRLFLDALESDGAITARERPALVDQKTGALSDAGRTFVEKTLLGSVIPNSRILDAAPASAVNKVAGALAPLARLKAAGGAWDITPALAEALELKAHQAARGLSTDELLDQSSLFGGEPDPRVAMMVRALDEKPTVLRRNLKDFAAASELTRGGQSLLAEFHAPDPERELEAIFGEPVAAHAFALPVAQPNEIERAPKLASPLAWHRPDGEPLGTLYFDGDEGVKTVRAAFADIGHPLEETEFLGVELSPSDGVAIMDAARRGSVAAQRLVQGAGDLRNGAALVWHRGTPAEMRAVRLEELAHLWQAHADAGDAGDALTPWDATELLTDPAATPAVVKIEARYQRQIAALMDAGRELTGIKLVAAEVGARLLMGDYGQLGLSEAAGDRLARNYVRMVEGRWQRGIGRASKKSGPELTARLRYLGAGATGESRPDEPLAGGGQPPQPGGSNLSVREGGRHPAPHVEARLSERHAASPVADAIRVWLGAAERAGQPAIVEGNVGLRPGAEVQFRPGQPPRLVGPLDNERFADLVDGFAMGGPGRWQRQVSANGLADALAAKAHESAAPAEEPFALTAPRQDEQRGLALSGEALPPSPPTAPPLFPVEPENSAQVEGGRNLPLSPAEQQARQAARLDQRQASLLGAEHEQELAAQARQGAGGLHGGSPASQGTLFSTAAAQPGSGETAEPGNGPGTTSLFAARTPPQTLYASMAPAGAGGAGGGEGPPGPPAGGAGAAPGSGGSRIGKIIAKPFRALDAFLSKYGSVSPEAKGAFKTYEAGREWRAVQAHRVATDLYDAAFDLLGPNWQTTRESLWEIQRNIVRPDDPRFALTAPEQAMKAALVAVRDRITLHDVMRGWLTPETLRSGMEAGAADMPKEGMAALQGAIGAWRQLATAAAPKPNETVQSAIRRFAAKDPDAAAKVSAGLGPDAQRLLRRWIETARNGVDVPYWPGSYANDAGTVARELSQGRPNPEAPPPLAARPGRAYKARTYQDLVEAEANGLNQNPDAIAVIMQRLDASLSAANAADLLKKLGELKTGEVQPVEYESYRGRELEKVPKGWRLASDVRGIRSKLGLEELAPGSGEALVSGPLADAIEQIVPAAGDEQGRLAKAARLAWVVQRAMNFWNIGKHPLNIGANAATEGYVEGTKQLARGDLKGAASSARIATAPINFAFDPDVRQGLRDHSGDIYDRAIKAGALRTDFGRAGAFGSSELPRIERIVGGAKRRVFGDRSGLSEVLRKALDMSVNVGHKLVFDYFDAGVRLKMFKELLGQGVPDDKAAQRVNQALVDYSDVARKGPRSWPNRVFYTLPWIKGNLKAWWSFWKRNPVATMLATGAIFGYMEWLNEKRTGHSMVSNPPGFQDRFATGTAPNGLPRYSRLTLPGMMPFEMGLHPQEFTYNRLDPNLRFGLGWYANENYPPLKTPNAITGEPSRSWPIVSDADRAAASVGEHWPGVKDRLGFFLRNEAAGPWFDIGRAATGKQAAVDTFAPTATRTYNPYAEFSDATTNADKLREKVLGLARQGKDDPNFDRALGQSVDVAMKSLARAVAQWRERPPATPADRERQAAYFNNDYRRLERAARVAQAVAAR